MSARDGSVYTFTADTIESVFSRDPINIPASPACSSLYLDVLYYSQANEGGADSGPTMSDIAYSAFPNEVVGSGTAASAVPGVVVVATLTGNALKGAYDHAKTP